MSTVWCAPLLDSGARSATLGLGSGRRACDRRSPMEAASSEAEKGVSVLLMIKARPPITLSCRVTPCRSTRSARKPKGDRRSPRTAPPGTPAGRPPAPRPRGAPRRSILSTSVDCTPPLSLRLARESEFLPRAKGYPHTCYKAEGTKKSKQV